MLQQLNLFRSEFDVGARSHLADEVARYVEISREKNVGVLFEQLKKISEGGKRIRPFLVWQIAQLGTSSDSYENMEPLLFAVEFFHIFCIIHDDVMDEATIRHGTPTLHHFAEKNIYKNVSAARSRRVAESQAILVGDILFNSVFKLLNLVSFNQGDQYREAVQIFHQLVDEVCIGQMIDVDLSTHERVDLGQVVEKNRLKTARYSFMRPLQIGAILARRSDLFEFCQKFGEDLGILYQVQDDLLDVIVPQEETSKTPFLDVEQNQHTMLTVHIRKTNSKHAQLLDSFAGRLVKSSDHEALMRLFVESGAIEYGKEVVEEYEKKIRRTIAESGLHDKEKKLFTEILQLIMHRTQ